jgi:SPX domain protein involved in polyphosphate accumulation
MSTTPCGPRVAQDFKRRTTKYWVRQEDVAAVKYLVMQHLPVFLQKGEKSDAQLINSVYVDNKDFELYYGRLDRVPRKSLLPAEGA